MEDILVLFDQFGVYVERLILQLAIILFLLFMLSKFAFKPLLEVLEKRKKMVEESVANAERIREELEKAEQSRKEAIAQAAEQASMIIEESRANAEKIGDKKVQEAISQAQEIVEKSQEAAAQDRERLMSELKQEVGKLVVATTEKVLTRTMTGPDKSRLEKAAIAEIRKN
ncbi:MAG: F0F1 ATP synthase subunit B [Verrucomicrobiota bacterium]